MATDDKPDTLEPGEGAASPMPALPPSEPQAALLPAAEPQDAEPAAPDEPPRRAAVPVVGLGAPAPGRRRVLVIDDNEDAAETTRMLLEAWGNETATAGTGAEGVSTARSFRPDVVLCDIGLPGEMDGYAVARALRADPTTQDALLVAMTGFGTDEAVRLAREAGFEVHLTKPAEPDRLKQVVASGRAPRKA